MEVEGATMKGNGLQAGLKEEDEKKWVRRKGMIGKEILSLRNEKRWKEPP